MFEQVRDLAARDDAEHGDQPEYRRDARKSVLFRATIYPADLFADVIIQDVSLTGVMGESDIEMQIGQTIHLTTDERSFYPGVVRWTRGRRFGLQFNEAQTLFGAADLDLQHGDGEGQLPRAERIALGISAKLVVGRPPRPATVRNISRFGMQLETSSGFAPGHRLLVKLNHESPIHGRVQWSKEGKIGLKSFEPMPAMNQNRFV
jgi:PilZ domain